MAETTLAMLAAPVAGVAVPAVRPVAVAIVLATALSMLGHWVVAGTRAGDLMPLVAVHATLGAAALALAAIGACARTLFTDPLDAGACALAATAIAGLGVFAIGPSALHIPEGVLNVALAASPIVAVAAAANVDLFRSETLYHMSPIAHRSFDYPAWHAASALYAACAALLLAARAGRLRWGRLVADDRRSCI